jgi:hypothetical protein
MWVDYLPERDLWVALIQITAFGASVFWALLSLWQMNWTLRDGVPKRNVFIAPFLDSPVRAAFVVLLLFGLIYVSHGTIKSDLARKASARAKDMCMEVDDCAWYRRAFRKFLLLPMAQFKAADLLKINGADGKTNNTDTVDLLGRDIQYAIAKNVNLTKVQFTSAKMNGIDLTSSVLPNAILTLAALESAQLGSADFSGAHLSNACLLMSNSLSAHFVGAKLDSAHLYGAVLANADFTDAIHGCNTTVCRF